MICQRDTAIEFFLNVFLGHFRAPGALQVQVGYIMSEREQTCLQLTCP